MNKKGRKMGIDDEGKTEINGRKSKRKGRTQGRGKRMTRKGTC